MVSSSLRTVALAALLALTVGAQAAHAAFTVDTVRAEPANTAASTFGDFTIEVNFPGDSTAEAMTIDLAAGNLAVLQALTPCARSEVQADRCGAASQLGTVSAVVKAPILGNITAPGSIYVIPAEGSEIGGLGVVVRPPIGDKLAMFGTIRLRTDGDYGVRAQLNGLPDEATLSVPLLGKIPLAITLRSMRMTLLGRTADGRGAGSPSTPPTAAASPPAWRRPVTTARRAPIPPATRPPAATARPLGRRWRLVRLMPLRRSPPTFR